MSCITRSVLRWGLIGGLALGGLTLMVGPGPVAAGFAQMRAKARGLADRVVDDPVALRHQLQQLADEYPDRIAEVRGEMAEVEHQITELDRDVEIATRVVAYTSEDLNVLKERLARAEAEAASTVRPVFIRFEGVRFDIDEARNEALRIGNVRRSYQDRLASDRNQQKLLAEQRSHLVEILAKLEDDFSQYQSQLWNLDRQIEALERNERVIELVEQQQETLASYDRFTKVGNLKQIEGRLAQLRQEQEAQLEYLRNRGFQDDYESKARIDLDSEEHDEILEELLESPDTDQPAAEPVSNSVAFLTPVIID